jgi:hypothetical protein
MRVAQLTLGSLLILLTPLVIPLPGPAGIFLFAGGLILILRNSRLARWHFVRAKRRWPRLGRIVDRAMRRPSTLRRIALEKHKASAPHQPEPCPAVRPH